MPTSKSARKRASSDHLREQANRNVRPAKGKSISKGRSGGVASSSGRPIEPASPIDDFDDHSEFEQHSSTDDAEDEEIEEVTENDPRRQESRSKGPKALTKDARVMAKAASSSIELTIVSGLPPSLIGELS